jgi:hypothetical protein
MIKQGYITKDREEHYALRGLFTRLRNRLGLHP